MTFAYDNLGNRTSMDTAGVSETTYAYDPLSRLTSETVDFDDLTSNYTISYGYQLSGKLKTVTDPFSAVVNYNDDRVGRTTSVTGSGFGNVSTYADDIQFRAFGAVKEMTYGSSDNSTISYEFDNRLRIDSYQSTSSVVSGGYVRKATYDYFADGQTKAVDNIVDARFDQAYKFDHMGRMTSSVSGLVTNSQDEEVPAYAQGIQYNAFGDMTSRGSDIWGNSNGFTATYINGRKQNSDEIYDASGNIVENPTLNPNIYDKWKFDAAGRVKETESRWYDGAPQQTSFDRTHEIEQAIDGDGQIIKRTETKTSVQIFPSNTHVEEKIEYFIRSSVLGGKILTELKPDGTKKLTSVYAGKGIIAEQLVFPTGSTVSWRHEDLVTGSFQKVSQGGTPAPYGDPENAAEFEPLGGVVPDTDPEEPDVSPFPDYRWGSDVRDPESCAWDGNRIDCSMIPDILRGYRVSHIEVNIRAPGGYNLAQRLDGAFTIKRTIEEGGVTVCDEKGNNCGDTETGTRYHYELIESPAGYSPIQTSTSVGVFLRQTPDYTALENATGFCASQLFGVNLTSIGWSGAGGKGEMKFSVPKDQYVPNYGNSSLMHSRANTFSIYNDASSYASSSNEMNKGANLGFGYNYGNGYLETYGIYQFKSERTGKKDWTNRTYTASDATGSGTVRDSVGSGLGFSTFNHVQIHEAGNALSKITGKFVAHDKNRNLEWKDANGVTHALNDDDDNGQVFEKCVFVNYRRLKSLHY